jgi:hypothetical protein
MCGQRVIKAKSTQEDLGLVEACGNQEVHEGPMAKCVWVVSAEGREVVGPR